MDDNSLKEKTISGLIWKFSERICAQGVSFVVSIILARLLLPEAYGVISLITIFITICDELIISGLNTALIQKKDADDIDFSTIFYFSFVVSFVLYIGLFLISPFIAKFYNMPLVSPVLRVMGLRLIIGAVNSIQHAYVSRTMQFRRFFYSTIIGTLGSAIVGIFIAYKGGGVWALVAQYCFNSLVDTVVLWFTVRWRPLFVFSWERFKALYSYGWKIFATGIIRTLYNNLRTLIIGKMYTSSDLAYYNKGQSFPSLIATNINGTIDSVLFPSISKRQDDINTMKSMLRRAIKISCYILMPMMTGLAVIAPQLIELLLTKKWLGCVFYLQISCVAFALNPIETENLQAIKALGKSDLALKLEVIKKAIGIILLLSSMKFGVRAIATSLLLSTIISTVINAIPNKMLLNYSIIEQAIDISSSIVLSIVMGGSVILVGCLDIPLFPLLIIQVIIGLVVYIGLSKVLNIESFNYLYNMVREKIGRKLNVKKHYGKDKTI